ncbi:hypothetical protein D910_09010 [Dendroctonus ponderosae]|uniref:RCC1-like domain-containing protein n=1 Tax=Dendroctonus ponderosae TaxID=77166 RepID=U4UH42_DENPD|nr:hypothetical protein D910_09010 [Dendroctonus ponderosae]
MTSRTFKYPYLANKVVECALGDNHTLFLTNEGQVYSCGNNDYGQLGHDQPRKRPQPVTGLDAYNIVRVACGATHSTALNQWGQVFSWGSDYHGQLGQQLGENIQPVPKIVKALASQHVIQLVCGQRHTVALTNNGDILAWGANNFGQLGIGLFSSSETTPKLVASLRGIPIVFITCGANHTFAISKSGAVYGWGKNTRGQLGVNDTENKMFPTQLRTMRNLRVRYIACGEEFSAFLTLDGGVFTCGAGMYGQLGHGSNSNEILPRQVIELMGSTITQVGCGRQHCLALVPSRGRVYSFGIGGSGQLGVRKTNSAYTPQAVLGPWVSPGGSSLIPSDNENGPNLVIRRLFAGGDHCFVSVVPQQQKLPPYDCRDYDPQMQILSITNSYIKTLLRIPTKRSVDQEVISFIETAFKSLACLNGSFLLEDDRHYYCTSKHHGVDMSVAESTFDIIGKVENESIQNLVKEHEFLTNILWTYEATFNSNGGVNLHNMHYWSRANPHWMQEVEHQGRFSVNVWCGIIGGRIIGPFIFEQKLNANIYLHFLQNQLTLLLEDIPVRKQVNMFLQQDGCPVHLSVNVRRFLDNAYRDR